VRSSAVFCSTPRRRPLSHRREQPLRRRAGVFPGDVRIVDHQAIRAARRDGRTLEHAAHKVAPDDYRDLLDRIDAAFAASRHVVEAAMSERVA
jgi:hypothetical protein